MGSWSEEVAEILSDRGYDVYSLDGGYSAYRALKEDTSPDVMDEKSAEGEEKCPSADTKETCPSSDSKELSCSADAKEISCAADAKEISTPVGYGTAVLIDAKGLKCPGPIVKVADYLRDKPIGERIVVEATEDAFASDISVWCDRTGNHLDELTKSNGVIRAAITRAVKREEASVKERNDKTFVVFSGDLDKTIASFIIANGAAAMGRKVTMFFTFWGLNILRKPRKVRVAKNFIEKMFSIMMPRGTTKLGLSRMNMGGVGAKMIRGIMKKKGISSLEELMESAKKHGVRLVACQMSMDIMGIRKEELIDGVELGGVATFLGSGEESDMSLFI
ncbi:MAG: DsrE/DsrF/DrsH-like family protein [Eubacterium sp.]|nr:DsrE/DsrF/DrsH-like family protein [Eubacterium sp.]